MLEPVVLEPVAPDTAVVACADVPCAEEDNPRGSSTLGMIEGVWLPV